MGSAVGIVEGGCNVVALAALAFADGEFGMNDELGITIVFIENSAYAEVTDSDFLRGIEINAAMNACQSPLVLIFEIRAVGVFQDFEDNMMDPPFVPPEGRDF